MTVKPNILICDDEKNMRFMLTDILRDEGYAIETAADGREGLGKIEQERPNHFSVIITDVSMPGMDGFEMIRKARQLGCESSFIIITAFATVDAAIKSMHSGASDFVVKPFGIDQIKSSIRRVLDSRDLLDQASHSLPVFSGSAGGYEHNIIGQDSQLKSIFQIISRIADLDTSVLIQGESGTGKELIAQAIHFNGARRDQPFVAVNCGALPEALLESEFFGHERGAFTGAHAMQKGKFELASGGTLFLDEVGEMPLSLQVKFLRVLQEKKFTRVGGDKEYSSDVRIIAATNRDLVDAVKQKTFREDFYYRLNVLPIRIPPLRERTGDIAALIQYFVKRFCARHKLPMLDLSPELLDRACHMEWKGNIRELQNAVEKAVILGDPEAIVSGYGLPIAGGDSGSVHEEEGDGQLVGFGNEQAFDSSSYIEKIRDLTVDGIDGDGAEIPDVCHVPLGDGETIRELSLVAADAQRYAIVRAIQICGGNKAEAAKRLGVSRKTLFNRINELGLRSESVSSEL